MCLDLSLLKDKNILKLEVLTFCCRVWLQSVNMNLFEMIVVIFVTKNGVYNVSGVSDRLLGYYLNYKHFSNEGFVLEYLCTALSS